MKEHKQNRKPDTMKETSTNFLNKPLSCLSFSYTSHLFLARCYFLVFCSLFVGSIQETKWEQQQVTVSARNNETEKFITVKRNFAV